MKIDPGEFFKKDQKIAMVYSVWKPFLKSHNHDFFEIAYVVKGSGYHILNGQRRPIEAGALFLITPKSEHNLIPRTEPFEWINVCFFPSVISPDLIDLVDTEDILNVLITSETLHYDTAGMSDIEIAADQQNLQRIFEEMYSEYEKEQPGYQNILKAYLEILLIKIFRSCFYVPSSETEISQTVLNYLHEKSFTDVDLSELARRSFYSPEYFRKLFKSKTGTSLSNFIRQSRLEQAKHLLESTDLSVNSIMIQVGFNDKKSFYSAFKSCYGDTPASFRK